LFNHSRLVLHFGPCTKTKAQHKSRIVKQFLGTAFPEPSALCVAEAKSVQHTKLLHHCLDLFLFLWSRRDAILLNMGTEKKKELNTGTKKEKQAIIFT
jgi:hypothetical protein